MIFRNPAGAPELACDACGCRWFDRMTNTCYECGEPVPAAESEAFAREATAWRQSLAEVQSGRPLAPGERDRSGSEADCA